MTHKHKPQMIAGVRVYSLGNGQEGTLVSRKVRLGVVRWEGDRTDVEVHLDCLGVVGDAMHANYAAK